MLNGLRKYLSKNASKYRAELLNAVRTVLAHFAAKPATL
jgi:hypothetical protein